MREAAIIKNGVPVNIIVLADGADGDSTIAHYASLGVVCVEITDVSPKPGLGIGWKYINGDWLPPQSSSGE